MEPACLVLSSSSVGAHLAPERGRLEDCPSALKSSKLSTKFEVNSKRDRASGDTIDGRLCFVTVGYFLQRLVNNPEDS